MSDGDNGGIASRIEALQKVNSYMKMLLNSTGSVFLLLDKEANVLYCNETILNLLGIEDISGIVGKPLSDIPSIYDDKDYFQRSVERYKRLLAGEDNFTEEDVINWPAKGRRLFQISHKWLVNEESGLHVIALILRDVTEERLQEDNRRILERMQDTQMPCMIWDENGGVINYNKEAMCFFGFSEDLLNDEPDRITAIQPMHQADGMMTEVLRQRIIEDTLRNGYSRMEVQLQKTDGTPLPVEVIGVRVSWQQGYRLFVYLRDLSDVRAREAEAKEAEKRLRTMLDSTPLICLLRDENNNIIDCNQEALNIFGVAHKDDFLESAYKIYPEFQPDGRKSTEKAQEMLHSLFQSGKTTFEWMFQTAKGEPLPVETTLIPISWKGANHYLSYSRDLREEKANEQKMRESIEQAREFELQNERVRAASEAKSKFLASMSHEIRTPMNTIIGLLELMRIDNLDAEQKSYIRDMKNMSAILLQIINDILDVYKIEAGKQEILPIHFNIDAFYNQLVSRYKFLAESKKLKFKSSLAPDLPRSVLGDELRIDQIVTNLLSNAIKYTRKGFVYFNMDSAMENGREYIVFTVEDSGIGIEEKNFATLFDEFEQFDTHKNRGITGAGLGLAIAKRLAELMGGNIRFKSEYGKGSLFTFSLPLIRGDLEKIAHQNDIERIKAKPDTKVLVVDDNAGNITVAVGLLGRHGIIPQTAGDGIQAIEMIKTNRYDLVFMDHMMPEMDGVEATAIIRNLDGEYYKKLPIIALSANAVMGARELFYECGMNDFVSKPIDGNDLNRALFRWLPPDKIVAEKAADKNGGQPAVEESVPDKMLEELIKIKDLSVTDGLARVGGDKKLYIELLWQFCNSADKDVKALKKFAKNNLWKEYTIQIHALKTVFANIGDQFLSDWAFSLEEAARHGDTDKCLNETHHFCENLKQLRKKLLQTDLMGDIVSQRHKKEISAADLQNLLEQLLVACHDFNAEAAEAIAGELPGLTFSKKTDASLASLHDLIHSFDYDQAAEIIEKLIKSSADF